LIPPTDVDNENDRLTNVQAPAAGRNRALAVAKNCEEGRNREQNRKSFEENVLRSKRELKLNGKDGKTIFVKEKIGMRIDDK
jgi:hypothetical protein